MSIVIDDPETERLARALAAQTGESVEEVVRRLLLEHAGTRAKQAEKEDEATRAERIAEARRTAERIRSKLSDDGRSADEILGYDERGLPT